MLHTTSGYLVFESFYDASEKLSGKISAYKRHIPELIVCEYLYDAVNLTFD